MDYTSLHSACQPHFNNLAIAEADFTDVLAREASEGQITGSFDAYSPPLLDSFGIEVSSLSTAVNEQSSPQRQTTLYYQSSSQSTEYGVEGDSPAEISGGDDPEKFLGKVPVKRQAQNRARSVNFIIFFL
jgi:hypothetical protein